MPDPFPLTTRVCGHIHDPETWQKLEAQYARRAWRAGLIKGILTRSPATYELLDICEVIDHFYDPKWILPDEWRKRVTHYVDEIDAYLLLDPCTANQRDFPKPA